MNLFKLSRVLKKVRVPVEASAVFVLLISISSAASTGPSWSSQPSWSGNSNGDSPSRRPNTSAARERYNSNLSPFSPGSNNVALDVGQVFLMGDLSAKYSDNIGTQIHYTFGVSDLFGFDSSLGYSEHGDGKYSMTTLLTGLRTNLAWYDKVVPYFVFGLGFYRPSIQTTTTSAPTPLNPQGITTTGSVAPVLFGVHMGPGVDLELTKQLFFGAALTFHDVFGGKRNYESGPVDVGGTFTSFFLHAGVTF